MENKKQKNGSLSPLDEILFPKDYSSSSPSSSTSDILASIFPPSPPVLGRDSNTHSEIKGSWEGNIGNPDHTSDSKGQSSGITNKDKSSFIYENQATEPCYLSSSIYYGGQENYSPRKKTTESTLYFVKEGGDDDPIGNNSSGASRGNWWQGSLYY